MGDFHRDVETLDTIHAAFLAGYELGHAHGRQHERAVIDQERRSALAGAIVARLASVPALDPEKLAREYAGRAATRARLASGRSA